MQPFISYLIQSAVCLALLYLPFRFFLREETFLSTNRWGLLAITVLSFILPLFNFSGTMQESYFSFPEITVVSYQTNPINTHPAIDWSTIVLWIYLSGMIIVLTHKIIEWIRLKRFIPKGCIWIHQENGIQIYCHLCPTASFSWMNSIVISLKDYEENGREILLHEMAHIRLHHSWDMLWLSILQSIQWFNPFVWLLSKDLQEIHEYEADQSVLRTQIDAYAYQMLLIKKITQSKRFPLANSFRHGLLKKRIEMMNKPSSHSLAKLKYIYLLPIGIGFIGIGTFSTLKTSELPVSQEIGTVLQYVSHHIKYPQQAIEENIQGKVVLEMNLDEKGNAKTIKVVEACDPFLEKEALRIAQKMPQWTNHPTDKSKYIIPIHFKLVPNNMTNH